jgi:hypothetical protein
MPINPKNGRIDLNFAARNKAILTKIARSGHRVLTAGDLDGLRKILDARRVRLKMTMEELDARTGLAHGYCAKLFCGSRSFGNASLRLVLKALGAKVAILPAYPGRGKRYGSNSICNGALDKERIRAAAKLGGLMKKSKMTPQQWKEFCRKGALARAAKCKHKNQIAAAAAARMKILRSKRYGAGPASSPRPSA